MKEQPTGRDGSIEEPYSALNLRLALAVFGLVTSGIFAALALRAGMDVLGWVLVVLAVVAAVDIVVIMARRRARRGRKHSLFE